MLEALKHQLVWCDFRENLVKRFFAAAAFLSVIACNQTPTPIVPPPVIPSNLRPSDSPDVLIIGISGKCFRDLQGDICVNTIPASTDANIQNSRNNFDYLTPKKTLETISATIKSKGYSVGYIGYAASYPDRVNSSDISNPNQYGFLTLMKDLKTFNEKWITGFDNPTKIVLVAHSHGVIWSHLIVRANPSITFEAQIDLDGVCMYWGTDNAGDFTTFGNRYGIAYTNICGFQTVGMGGTQSDIQNIVFDNVKKNIEIQSDPLLVDVSIAVRDAYNNRRLDGSSRDIVSRFSTGEGHGKVAEATSNSINFVRFEVSSYFSQK